MTKLHSLILLIAIAGFTAMIHQPIDAPDMEPVPKGVEVALMESDTNDTVYNPPGVCSGCHVIAPTSFPCTGPYQPGGR